MALCVFVRMSRRDADVLVDAFLTKNKRFDYVAFCKALEGCDFSASPRKHAPQSRSPSTKSPSKRRRNWLLEQQSSHSRHATAAHGGGATSETDAASRPEIRVDKRLEAQRLAIQSIRKKLLHGVVGAKSDGFLGVQDALFNLDADGEGYLDEQIFVDQFLPRLKSPLTKSERDFLLMSIRMRGGNQRGAKKRSRVDYEQIGVMCNLDSDVSFSSESGEEEDDDVGWEEEQNHSGHRGRGGSGAMSPAKASITASSNLGADFLASEKRVQEFLRQRQQQTITDAKADAHDANTDTPRSLFTGAEVFLDKAEEIDARKSGFLHEQGTIGAWSASAVSWERSFVVSSLCTNDQLAVLAFV